MYVMQWRVSTTTSTQWFTLVVNNDQRKLKIIKNWREHKLDGGEGGCFVVGDTMMVCRIV